VSTITATFTVTDTGRQAGTELPQLYLAEADDDERSVSNASSSRFRRVSRRKQLMPIRTCSRASTERSTNGASRVVYIRSRWPNPPGELVLTGSTI
jgi:hypothetical protein